MSTTSDQQPHHGDDIDNFIAVVGMAGRYPESPNLDAFWSNLRNGKDCLHTFTDEELSELGIPLETVNVDNFVRRGTRLPDRDNFDAQFFGYTPRNAAITDPQARIFLETCYEAIENSGYNPFDPGCPIGVFAGSNPNDYALLLGVADPTDSLGAFDQLIGVDRDFIATRVSHKLGLTGPAMTIQTACSTSLVTVHLAVQSLLSYECSMALAGGVSVNLRQGVGYFYQPGMILSPNGECRAFDARAEGTTLGQGCGVVVLKRLAEAEADGDNIMAVIRATAINNDGSNKIGYTAPSEDGQVEVITMAHELAGISSDSIGYVETHGTGTLLGDPIEIAALTRAFRPGTNRQQYCAIGSAKTNFGHTDAAAGITGFIKAVLSLHHREIAPSIHFDQPNPEIDFANSPFYVSTELQPFPSGPTPRRAGVSAFGIGGTNAHVVLEEAPVQAEATSAGPTRPRVLTVSARSSAAAEQRVVDLAGAVAAVEGTALEAVDFTLRRGRPLFDHRRAIVVSPDFPLAETLNGSTDASVVRGETAELGSPQPSADDLVWLFAGQGAQFPAMGAGLYQHEPVFQAAIDQVADHLAEALDADLRSLLYPAATVDPDEASERLRQTSITQPALFAVEYAMAQLLRSWGIAPSAVLGHSIGEYAAAVEAGIMRWSDAASLVAERGRLMQSMEPGAMLSTPLRASELVDRLPAGAELAADNSTALSVASGPTAIIESLAADLEDDGVSVQVLHTSHAFHSAMMDSAAEQFVHAFDGVVLSAPSIPLISNVTGHAITDSQAIDPDFWASQIRRPVNFTQCLKTCTDDGRKLFAEIGPGRALTTFALAASHSDDGDNDTGSASPVVAVPTMRHPRQSRPDQVVLLEAVGRLWTVGYGVDWDAVNGPASPSRVPLPTYPFERAEAWLPPHRHVLALPHFGPPTAATPQLKREPLDRWLYAPSWQRMPAGDQVSADGTTVVLAPNGPSGDRLIGAMTAAGANVIDVRPVTASALDSHIAEVFSDLADRDVDVTAVVHAWTATPEAPFETVEDLSRGLDRGVHASLACARALAPLVRRRPIRLSIVTAGAFSVTGGELVRPDAAALLGPTRVIPLEYTGLTTRLIDLPSGLDADADLEATVTELGIGDHNLGVDDVVALRGGHRWEPSVAVRPTRQAVGTPKLRPGGRYLIVGGLGGVGLSIADYLADHYRASLILTARRGRPVPANDDDTEAFHRLEILQGIEANAEDVQVVAIDMTDEQAMADMVTNAERDGKPIDGVIVAAGVADQAGAIHRRTRADMEASIASKVHGLVVLDRALGNRQLDFVVLSSSIAATLYHNRFAQVGYVTGNAFAEAFAVRSRQRGRPVTAMAWDDWLDVGMSVRAARDFSADFGTEVDLVDKMNSFAPADGVALFTRALQIDEPVLLVSPTDLGQRIASDVDVVSPFLQQAMSSDEEPEIIDTANASTLELVSSIWTALLGFETFNPTDDFFELGGDSLQAARMVDRLSRALNVDVPVDVVFDNAQLTSLVSVLEELESTSTTTGDEATPDSTPAPPVGPARLGPGQLRFLARGTEHPNHFNVSVLLRPKRYLDPDHVEAAVAAVMATHDALRLTIDSVDDDTDLHQQPQPRRQGPTVDVVDLAARSQAEASAQLNSSTAETQQSLSLSDGPVFRSVLYQMPEGDQRLLLTIHHLVSDRVSLLLIMDAIDSHLQRLEATGEVAQVQRPPSFLQWIAAQEKAATTNHGELTSHWSDRRWGDLVPLPVDHASTIEANRNSHVEVVNVSLSADKVGEASARAQARADEVALWALATAIGEWSGASITLIDVMGHGRRLPLDVDVTRSVGMFITYSPVLVDHTADGLDQQLNELRSDLDSGWSFDALRFYGPPDVRQQFVAQGQAQVLFNYVGQSIATTADALLVSTDEDRGVEVDPNGRRDHPLAVRADLHDNGDLGLIFVYSTMIHDASTIEALAARTVELLADAGTTANAVSTPAR